MKNDTEMLFENDLIAYQLLDDLLGETFEAGTIVTFKRQHLPKKSGFPVLVDVGGEIQIRLYRPLFEDVYELYTPWGHEVLRSDRDQFNIVAGAIRIELDVVELDRFNAAQLTRFLPA